MNRESQRQSVEGTQRRALTLVELLVVIAIVATVTVATIPIVLPALDSRRMRESARLLSTQLAAAQTMAISTGRPAGLWIERMAADRVGAMDLYLAETPEPYAGDAVSSTCRLQFRQVSRVVRYTPTGPPTPAPVDVYEAVIWLGGDIGWVGLLRYGDRVRFKYAGGYPYRAYNPDRSQTDSDDIIPGPPVAIYLESLDPTNIAYDVAIQGKTWFRSVPFPAQGSAGMPNFPAPFPDPYGAGPPGWSTPYNIQRQPIKLATGSVSLPAGAVIDLNLSGIGNRQLHEELSNPTVTEDQFADGTTALNRLPIVVMFNAAGALDNLYMRREKIPIPQPLHLLIGKREKVFRPLAANFDRAESNLYDLETLWVSANPQSGLVTTAEMAALTPPTGPVIMSGALPLQEVRQFATSGQAMGGR